MISYWISCPKFTVQIEVNEDQRIVKAAPIVYKFVGQPLQNLITWAERFGQTMVERL